jgi:hypothetical protein
MNNTRLVPDSNIPDHKIRVMQQPVTSVEALIMILTRVGTWYIGIVLYMDISVGTSMFRLLHELRSIRRRN